jgi:hypothetical protein
MRKTLAVWAVGVALAMGGTASIVGCGSTSTSSSRPAAGSLAEGLTVLDARADWGTTSAFKEAGHVVYLETRVGPMKPQVYRENFPNEPQNEMDTRIVDDVGRTFTLVIGGDSIIDPTWSTDIRAGAALAAPTKAESDMYYALAQHAGQAFAAAQPQFADHVFHLSNATAKLPSEDADLAARANTQLKASIEAGVITKFDSITNQYLEGDLCVGHHSTVWGWQGNYDFTTSSWSWVANVVACNHGPCANSSSLSYQESSYSGGSSNWVPSALSLTSLWSDEPTSSNTTYTSGHGCQSGYNWDTPPGHECNDDSSYELWQIHDSPTNRGYGNTSNGNGTSFCAKSGGNGNACNCSSSCNSCSGDWSYPPAP